jgi:molecular chaperone DnaK (HSP70)
MVGFDDKLVVGEDTDDMPDEQVVRSIKRCITDERYMVRVETADGLRDLVADDAMAELLREVARRAVARGLDLGNLRLGCPAMWDRRQRRRLLEICDRAGLLVDFASLVDEPVAAGIAWLAQRGQGGRSTEPIRVLVFDMGGGTLDIAVLDVRGLSHQDVSVLAALGTTDAGDLLDQRIAEDMEQMLAGDGVVVENLDRADPAARTCSTRPAWPRRRSPRAWSIEPRCSRGISACASWLTHAPDSRRSSCRCSTAPSNTSRPPCARPNSPRRGPGRRTIC